MKKHFLLPAFAILLAAGGAFASGKFAVHYYDLNDSTCQTEIPKTCTPGTGAFCQDDAKTGIYYYKASEVSPCTQLRKLN